MHKYDVYNMINKTNKQYTKKINKLPELDTSSMSLPSRISSSFWAADMAQFTPGQGEKLEISYIMLTAMHYTVHHCKLTAQY